MGQYHPVLWACPNSTQQCVCILEMCEEELALQTGQVVVLSTDTASARFLFDKASGRYKIVCDHPEAKRWASPAEQHNPPLP